MSDSRDLAASYGDTVLTCVAITPEGSHGWQAQHTPAGMKIVVRDPACVLTIGMHREGEADMWKKATENQKDAVTGRTESHPAAKLPTSWHMRRSRSTGRTFYWNDQTGHSQFAFPQSNQTTDTLTMEGGR